jgi:hypothetical protein
MSAAEGLTTPTPEELTAAPVRGSAPFYLTDAMVNISGVRHFTPGLREFEGRPLTNLVINNMITLITFFGGGPAGSGILATEVGRTVVCEGCSLTCFFGISVYNNHGKPLMFHGKKTRKKRSAIRFSEVQPECRLTSNGRFEVRIRVSEAKDVAGQLTLKVTRDGAENPNPLIFKAKDITDLQAQLNKKRAIAIPPPPDMNALDKRVVVEDIVASAVWKPTDTDPCPKPPFTERLRIRWQFATRVSTFVFGQSNPKPIKSKIGVKAPKISHGTTIKPITYPDGRTIHSVAVQPFYSVSNPDQCCGTADTEYAVIQFVRREWNLKEASVKRDQDNWSLDILDTEIQRSGARPPQPYDPTFTHNPRGSDPTAPPLVYPGPGPAGDQSITQTDYPGLSPRLINRFLAAPGSEFTFHFMSFLVCKLNPSTSANYLTNGMVSQVIEYRLQILFRGRDQSPTVKFLDPQAFKKYDPCQPFYQLINDKDNERLRPSRRKRKQLQGRLRAGYDSPRDHKVGIPRK